MLRRPPTPILFPYTTLFRSIRDIGYEQEGFHWERAEVLCHVHEQSSDIAQGVDALRDVGRSEEHTSELQSRQYLVCRLLLEKKNQQLADETVFHECPNAILD